MKNIFTALSALIFSLNCLAAVETNPTYSPDSSMVAFTRGNDLYVRTVATSEVKRLTYDGSKLILNGYASWVYYEEIFGRPSKYRAFWWSPDSRKLAYYRFDNSKVPEFPIFSAAGTNGSLNLTRYPKAGQKNPSVKVFSVDVKSGNRTCADFDYDADGYFGIPFWGEDSNVLFVPREPRIQNKLELFRVNVANGSIKCIYSETYKTWVEWMTDMLFDRNGLYMVRAFESGWEQIYYLSYDGSVLKRLTDGQNWRTHLVSIDKKTGTVYFTAHRDSDVRSSLYGVSPDGTVTTLSDTSFDISGVSFADDFQSYTAWISNLRTPPAKYSFNIATGEKTLLEDKTPEGFDASGMCLPELIYLTMADGLKVPATITYPKGFKPKRKYPLVMEIYGGPNNAYVRDTWRNPRGNDTWYAENGIIKVVADSRVSGHNGRAGTDMSFRDVVSVPVSDFISWANYFRTLPYVDGKRIGVEGFSFGGTMTAALVMKCPDLFRCGVAGGGVYDWSLYDSHYTERFMLTPELNPDGYARSRVLDMVQSYDDSRTRLKLTHGTADDNVHFQNTLLLTDTLQKAGKQFELMIYPDGMHGYRGAQGSHDRAADQAFWKEQLL